MADKNFNPFSMAQQQFDAVAEKLDLDQGSRAFLREPLREYHFSIPVKMDDLPLKAKRPSYSALDNHLYTQLTGQTPRSWEEALKNFISHQSEMD